MRLTRDYFEKAIYIGYRNLCEFKNKTWWYSIFYKVSIIL